MNEATIPILIGASQYVQRKNATQRLDPLSLMVKTGNKAIKSTDTQEIREKIDAIFMININSWSYADAPRILAKNLNISLKEKVYLPDGGNTPQMLVNWAARAISNKEHKAILIIGAEAAYSVLLANKGEIKLDWPKKEPPAYMEGEIWDGINDFENSYKFKFPPYTYSLFETAIRAESNRSLKEHRDYMGKLFHHFSEVAAEHPYSWTQKVFTAEEIIIPTNKNRKISHPYTKRMCSNMFVDQSAAVLMTSQDLAKELEISQKKWVYLMGCADFKNVHEITQRPALHTSPASRKGSRIALKQAGLELKDIDSFDLYSCFPSIVEIMMNEIGIPESDSRDLTLTGGLPYFGGPWSNYSLHAIATAVEKIQSEPKSKIMVVANGGYNSKQSFGIYGNQPPRLAFGEINADKIQNEILSNKLSPPLKKANGMFTIEGYTILYNREQEPREGIVIGKINENQRSLAFIRESPEELVNLAEIELVSKKVQIRYDEELERNIVFFD